MERFLGAVLCLGGLGLLVYVPGLWCGPPPHHAAAVGAAVVALVGIGVGWRLYGGPDEPYDALDLLDVLSLFDD